ncbi:acyl-CoA synthetase (NDP forming)/GNAT superfamily N-acetyltransferase [Neomicrococcus aestuarii]|uniref:Acyl-CoA synthetase (NDP forming)/GNAT superfamily N-acetyltransferase n=1 Tax=Neomicrococcus aestuarii TaxID=556325 RepID=A0A7W8X120_9MICC|nr:bifunctional GNAT family N-acetyltransferase/acetate--CoA ligase family protein [Neomicrococcus aestuarii]MBB5513802.1 acyl-CoA synthetase (NDP forming)/GNAT superfamily N-acetyltransferase [Neomicrococcus aestuarii]
MVDGQKSPGYPAHWEADVVLKDGSTAHIRPITPQDAAGLEALHAGQSETSIYLRFFTYKARLTEKELKRFTEVDHKSRVALIVERSNAIIGVGRYDRLDDPEEAEVAFNISDAFQGQGLGSILIEHLAAAARENGIERFSAEVLPENRKMITVFNETGFDVKRHFDDGVVMVEFPIDPTEKSRAVMESREHRAEAKSLVDLLNPRSVAVIGASRDWGTVGYSFMEHIVDGGFEGPVYAVNPEALELAGTFSYSRLSEVPGPVDLAVVSVPRDQIMGVARDCAAAGVRGMLVATAGFDDGGSGLEVQRELVRVARVNGMRVIGPASLGIVNTDPAVKLNASMAPGLPREGGLALFSQSAAIGAILYAAASRSGLGISSIVSAGNRADMSGNDAMQYWEDDERTKVVGLYLESFGNPRKFSRIARRLSQKKPVIVAKSDVMGLRLPPGHEVRATQAPLGAVDAMLEQSGVIRVGTYEQLMDVAQIIESQPLPAGDGLGVLSNSRALGRVVADNAETKGLKVAVHDHDLSLNDGLTRSLPRLKHHLMTVLEREDVHTAVVTLLPSPGITERAVAEAIEQVGAETGKTVITVFAGITDPTALVDGLFGKLPCFSSPGRATNALAQIVRYVQWRRRDFGSFAEPEDINLNPAEDLVHEWSQRANGTELVQLSDEAASELLACYGITMVPSAKFADADAGVAAANRLGWPVVLKTQDQYLRHRLDLGGVQLNIPDEASLRHNIMRMTEVMEPYGATKLEVQHMVDAGQGTILRAIEDPLLGPLVSFGISGDAVLLLDDWAHGIPPLSSTDVSEFVRSPQAARKLFGYEGVPPVNIDLLENIVRRIAILKDNHPEVALLEINPLVASERTVSVLSVDIRVADAARRTDSARRAVSTHSY